jgi:hypothetical protein
MVVCGGVSSGYGPTMGATAASELYFAARQLGPHGGFSPNDSRNALS